MGTPTNTNLITRYAADMFDDRDYILADSGFQAIFGRAGSQTIFAADDEVVEIDIIRGNKDTATLAIRGSNELSLGTKFASTNEQKFNNQAMEFPLSKQYGNIAAGQVTKRLAGETLRNPLTKEQRARILMMKQAVEHTKRSIRLHERLAAQMIRTGKQDAVLGTVLSAEQFDFSRTAGNTITPAIKWNAANATIDEDIEEACVAVEENGHMSANVGIVGDGAIAALLDDTDTIARADNRGYGLIRIGQTEGLPSDLAFMTAAGFTAVGFYTTSTGRKIWLFTYSRTYTSGGTSYKYMPTDEMVIFDSRARCDRYFGPSDWLPTTTAERQFYMDVFGMDPMQIAGAEMVRGGAGVVDPRMFYHKAWPNGNNSVWAIESQTAPLFATVHVDAFATLNTLV
jgi:hypothetical protein